MQGARHGTGASRRQAPRREEAAFGDVGCQGVHKRAEARGPAWHLAMRPGLQRQLNPFIAPQFKALTLERCKASARAQVEHPFRVLIPQSSLATRLGFLSRIRNPGTSGTLSQCHVSSTLALRTSAQIKRFQRGTSQ